MKDISTNLEEAHTLKNHVDQVAREKGSFAYDLAAKSLDSHIAELTEDLSESSDSEVLSAEESAEYLHLLAKRKGVTLSKLVETAMGYAQRVERDVGVLK